MSKKMMILGGSALQLPAINKAKEMGYEIILVDYDANAVGFALADVKLVIDTMDQDEVYRQALIYLPDVVLTSTSDGPVRTAAYVNERLGKNPDLSYEDSKCATIKSYMRERLKQWEIPIPEFYAVHNFEEFKEAVRRLRGYCIVKPADNAGSRGVALIDCLHGDAALRDAYECSLSNSKNGVVMVEEYMSGAEVSVEAITVNRKTDIIAITDKYVTPLPYFVEIGHSEPSCLETSVQEQIKEITLQAVKAIGLINGPSHTEVKITESGPKIVELAARLGGDFITSKLVPLSTGVDIVGNSIILAGEGEVDLTPARHRGSAIRFLLGTPGIIQNITIEDKIFSLEGLEEFVLYKKKGDSVQAAKSSNDRLGYVVAVGETAQAAMETAEEALKYITVEIR